MPTLCGQQAREVLLFFLPLLLSPPRALKTLNHTPPHRPIWKAPQSHSKEVSNSDQWLSSP